VHQLVASFEELIAAELTHPAMAVPLATGITNVWAYLAQDYVAAESLDLAVRGYGPAPPADALRVAAQLGGALDFAAVASIYHGALHPRDVLLSSDETRLTGVGIVRALDQVGVAAPVRRPYTAPERIAGAAWDRRADVFSLAALIYQLLWGRRISGNAQQVADGLSQLPGAHLKALQATFARALAEEPNDRFGTALEFAESLKEAFPDVALTEPAPPRKRASAAKKTSEARLPLEEPAASVVPPLELASPAAALPTVGVPPATSERGEPREVGERKELDEVENVHRVDDVDNVHRADELPDLRAPSFGDVREPLSERVVAEPPAISVLERSRSAVWPLMAALLIGLAIGFAGGYGIGSREHQPVPSADLAPVSVPAAPAAPATVPTRQDPTEVAVPTARKPAPDRPTPNRPARNSSAPGRAASDRTASGRAPTERTVPGRTSPARAPASEGTTAPGASGTAGRFVGGLSIESRPDGARVFLDGKLMGTTPLAVPSISAGEHAIRLERDGYRRWSSSVRIVASEQNRVTASLER
jgi:hypothetical protein